MSVCLSSSRNSQSYGWMSLFVPLKIQGERDGYSPGRNHCSLWISITLAWICSFFFVCVAMLSSNAFQGEMLFGEETQTLPSKKRTCFTQGAHKKLFPFLMEKKLVILDRIIWLERKLVNFAPVNLAGVEAGREKLPDILRQVSSDLHQRILMTAKRVEGDLSSHSISLCSTRWQENKDVSIVHDSQNKDGLSVVAGSY